MPDVNRKEELFEYLMYIFRKNYQANCDIMVPKDLKTEARRKQAKQLAYKRTLDQLGSGVFVLRDEFINVFKEATKNDI